MPYVEMKLSIPLSAQQTVALKTTLGQLIPLIPTKTEKSLMVCLEGGHRMFLAGDDAAPTAYCVVKLFRPTTVEAKDAFVRALAEVLAKDYGVEATRLYVNFEEHPVWGSGGVLKT